MLSALKNAGYRAVAVTNAKQQEAKKRRASSAATTNDTPELEPAEAVNDDDDDDRDSSVTLSKYGGSSPSVNHLSSLAFSLFRFRRGANLVCSNYEPPATEETETEDKAGVAIVIVTTIAAIPIAAIAAKEAQTPRRHRALIVASPERVLARPSRRGRKRRPGQPRFSRDSGRGRARAQVHRR